MCEKGCSDPLERAERGERTERELSGMAETVVGDRILCRTECGVEVCSDTVPPAAAEGASDARWDSDMLIGCRSTDSTRSLRGGIS